MLLASVVVAIVMLFDSGAFDATPPSAPPVEPTVANRVDPNLEAGVAVERARAASNRTDHPSIEAESTSAETSVVDESISVRARVADLSGRWLPYDEVSSLLPNRDPLSSFTDLTPARGACELRAIDSLTRRIREIPCHVMHERDGSTALCFDVERDFVATLQLISRDQEVSRVDFRAGDPDPVFLVDLAAQKARLATLRIRLGSDESLALPFQARIEREDGGIDAFDGEMRSWNGEMLVLESLPAGTYRITGVLAGHGIAPAQIVLEAGADETVTLESTEECGVVVRLRLSAVFRREGTRNVEVDAPAAYVGTPFVRVPMESVMLGRVPDASNEMAETISLRYGGLPPGPLLLVLGSDSKTLVLQPGDNGIVDFELRDTVAISLELREVGARAAGRISGLARLELATGATLASRRLDFDLRSDGSATTSIDLVPGAYRGIFELENGVRRVGAFEVTPAGGTVVLR